MCSFCLLSAAYPKAKVAANYKHYLLDYIRRHLCRGGGRNFPRLSAFSTLF